MRRAECTERSTESTRVRFGTTRPSCREKNRDCGTVATIAFWLPDKAAPDGRLAASLEPGMDVGCDPFEALLKNLPYSG